MHVMNRSQTAALLKGYIVLSLVILYTSLSSVTIGFQLDVKPNAIKPKAKCDLCNGIYKKFNEALKSTEKANFGGGNTKWEEKSLGKFKYSETRLVEVMDMLCEKSNQECHLLIEQNEEDIEDYWYNVFPTDQPVDFYKWFCIDKVRVCCRNGTYGEDCLPCPGGSKRPCSGHGECQGDGTRQGTGKCSCHSGYAGDMCDECQTNYYRVSGNTTDIVCSECDKSCKDSCSEGGPKGCHDCKTGYIRDDTNSCTDVDECVAGDVSCRDKEFCLNTPGSYECQKCDEACSSCTGGGAGNCVACSGGYQLDGSVCKDIGECLDETLCRADHERCENVPGSHFCGCIDGYIRSNDACIPKPTDESENGAKTADVPTPESAPSDQGREDL